MFSSAIMRASNSVWEKTRENKQAIVLELLFYWNIVFLINDCLNESLCAFHFCLIGFVIWYFVIFVKYKTFSYDTLYNARHLRWWRDAPEIRIRPTKGSQPRRQWHCSQCQDAPPPPPSSPFASADGITRGRFHEMRRARKWTAFFFLRDDEFFRGMKRIRILLLIVKNQISWNTRAYQISFCYKKCLFECCDRNIAQICVKLHIIVYCIVDLQLNYTAIDNIQINTNLYIFIYFIIYLQNIICVSLLFMQHLININSNNRRLNWFSLCFAM